MGSDRTKNVELKNYFLDHEPLALDMFLSIPTSCNADIVLVNCSNHTDEGAPVGNRETEGSLDLDNS